MYLRALVGVCPRTRTRNTINPAAICVIRRKVYFNDTLSGGCSLFAQNRDQRATRYFANFQVTNGKGLQFMGLHFPAIRERRRRCEQLPRKPFSARL